MQQRRHPHPMADNGLEAFQGVHTVSELAIACRRTPTSREALTDHAETQIQLHPMSFMFRSG
jgi:hypothetical protein